MGRFSASKYKNAAPKKLKREHLACGVKINELCQNTPIACGIDKVAYAAEGAGIGLLDVGEVGNVQPRILHGHGEFVRSFDFNPFNKDCLCTCAGDATIKLWDTTTRTCSTTLRVSEHVHEARFHPVAGNVILAAESDAVTCYDVVKQKQILSGRVQCTTASWSYDGRLVSAAGRNGEVTIVDLRARNNVASATLFDNNKDIQHEWLGVDKLVLAGYKGRDRTIKTVDISDISRVISSISYGSGSGNPFVKFDYDTRMLFCYAKGDHTYNYCEVGAGGVMKENSKESSGDAIKGITLAPKTSLDVMSGEVARLMILHHGTLAATPYVVPRKSYHDFHDDLFPETRGPQPGVDGEGWFNGNDGYRELISLDPASQRHTNGQNGKETTAAVLEKKEEVVQEEVEENEKHKQILSHLTDGQSLYRNIEGKLSHRDFHFHGLKNVQSVFSLESNGFQVGKRYGAFIMVGSGGRLGIIDLHQPGQNNTRQLELVNQGTPIAFQWDPFSADHVIAIGGDSAQVKLWKVTSMDTPPELLLEGNHTSKVTMVEYHPCVAGLLATCDTTGHVILWDTVNKTQIKSLGVVREDSIALCWDVSSGYHLYVAAKSGEVVGVDTRTGIQTVAKTTGELRSGRLACTKDALVLSSLGHGNSRTLHLFSTSPSLALLEEQTLGNGTSLYSPFLDIDMNVGYLCARGEGAILPFEFRASTTASSSPRILALSQFISMPDQYACCMMNRQCRDVMKVETAKFYKLTKDSIQLVTFSVPRLRTEYFQDDLFPLSIDLSSPVLTVSSWVEEAPFKLKKVDLCPADVKRQSEVEIVRHSSQHSKIQQEHLKYKSIEASRDELFNAFAEQVQQDAGPLEQDLMEGCDDDEWSD